MIAIWVMGVVVGAVVAALTSRRAVVAALEISEALGISTGLVGVSVMAIGTDLPEIANSITASIADHGDVNVGDSTGSALAQVTLVLALLLLATPLGSDLRSDEARVAVPAGLMTVGALVALAIMLSDGTLGRVDGLLLAAGWLVTLAVLERQTRESERTPPRGDRGTGAVIARTLGWLVLVGLAASVVVRSFVELTDTVGVPEFVASTIVLALGTSLPELVVDWTAIRRGAGELAVGVLFGATLMDATLSVGIGPIVSPTAVSPETTIGTMVIAVGIAVTTILVAFVTARRNLAGALIGVYLVATTTLVVLAG